MNKFQRLEEITKLVNKKGLFVFLKLWNLLV